MGNQCDQCEVITSGCKRQKFRQQLKNRQKIDLSRSHGLQKSITKLNTIVGQSLQQSERQKNINSVTVGNQQSSYETKNRNISPQKQLNMGQIQRNITSSPDNSANRNQKGMVSYDEVQSNLKQTKLPIQSGKGLKNKNKLQELQKQLDNNRRLAQLQTTKPKNDPNPSKNNKANAEDDIKQSHLQYGNKQNSSNYKNKPKDFKMSKNLIKHQIQIHSVQKQYISDNSSKVLRSFNNQLRDSNFNDSQLQQISAINEHEIMDESVTYKLELAQEHHYYVQPAVYFDGFVSASNKKIQNQANIKFQDDGTQLSVHFNNGQIDLSKNVKISFRNHSYFQGKIQDTTLANCGFGKLIFPDGSYYIGEWLKNLPHGKGKHKYPDGSQYQGEFIEGRKQGKGKFVTSQEQLIYEGSFVNNNIEGLGRMQISQPNNNKRRIYKGYFRNGKLEGDKCEVQYVNQSANFIGSFHQGRKQGQGKYFYGDGRTWEGLWKDNRQDGFGKYKDLKGHIIEGYWIDGIKSQNKLHKY